MQLHFQNKGFNATIRAITTASIDRDTIMSKPIEPTAHQTIQYTPVWRRFAAIVYDSLLVTAISMAYGALGLVIAQWLGDADTAIAALQANVVIHRLFQLGWLIVIISFFCFFWMKAGQTLGMRAWRLKIVKEETTQTPTLAQCLLRLFLAPLGLLLFFIGLLRNDKQCLHDLFSKTQVVLLPKGS